MRIHASFLSTSLTTEINNLKNIFDVDGHRRNILFFLLPVNCNISPLSLKLELYKIVWSRVEKYRNPMVAK
jgi:uncharacterized membrane protein YozB (DUF420 family)